MLRYHRPPMINQPLGKYCLQSTLDSIRKRCLERSEREKEATEKSDGDGDGDEDNYDGAYDVFIFLSISFLAFCFYKNLWRNTTELRLGSKTQ